MERIYCPTCDDLFYPTITGYGEINTICPICGDDTQNPTITEV